MKNENKNVYFSLLCCSLLSGFLSCLYLFEDSKSFIEHCGVIDTHETTIRTWLEVDTHALTCLEVLATEEVTYGLYAYTEFVSDTVHATIGQ